MLAIRCPSTGDLRLALCQCCITGTARYCCFRFRGFESFLPAGLPPSLPLFRDARALFLLSAPPRQAGQNVIFTVTIGVLCTRHRCFIRLFDNLTRVGLSREKVNALDFHISMSGRTRWTAVAGRFEKSVAAIPGDVSKWLRRSLCEKRRFRVPCGRN